MKFAVTVTIDTVTWMNVTVSVNSLSVAFGTTAPVLREGLSSIYSDPLLAVGQATFP